MPRQLLHAQQVLRCQIMSHSCPSISQTVSRVYLVKRALEVGSAPVRPHDGGPAVQQHTFVVVQRRCSSRHVLLTSSRMSGRSLCSRGSLEGLETEIAQATCTPAQSSDTPPRAGSMALLSRHGRLVAGRGTACMSFCVTMAGGQLPGALSGFPSMQCGRQVADFTKHAKQGCRAATGHTCALPGNHTSAMCLRVLSAAHRPTGVSAHRQRLVKSVGPQ